jgi:hypothetical protein
MNWALGALVSAQAAAAAAAGSSGSEGGGGGGGFAALALLSAGSAGAPLIGTVALKEGLKRVGYAASKEALATLRSAFRLRGSAVASLSASSASSASSSAEGEGRAAIRADLVVAYLCLEDYAAAPLLERVDEESRARGGSRGGSSGGGGGGGGAASRPPRAPVSSYTAPAQLLAQGSAGEGGVAGGYLTPVGHGTPQRPYSSSSGGGLAAALVTGRAPLQVHQHQQFLGATSGSVTRGLDSSMSSSSSGGLGGGFGAPPLPPQPPAPAISASVGEWIGRHATQGERENLVAFMGLVAEFQARNGLAAAPSGAAALAATGDSLVVPLGPNLRVGLRLYVP